MLGSLKSFGTGFPYCDRFHIEYRVFIKQHGASLDDLRIEYSIRGRLNVTKSLGFAHSIVTKIVKNTLDENYLHFD